jgi:hypothetical protein
MFKQPRIVTAGIFLLTFAIGASTAIAVTFSDGTFNDADWTSSLQVLEGPFSSVSHTETQVASGGNPDAYRLNIREWGFGTRAAVYNLNSLAVYDPSTQGAIASVNFLKTAILLP